MSQLEAANREIASLVRKVGIEQVRIAPGETRGGTFFFSMKRKGGPIGLTITIGRTKQTLLIE